MLTDHSEHLLVWSPSMFWAHSAGTPKLQAQPFAHSPASPQPWRQNRQEQHLKRWLEMLHHRNGSGSFRNVRLPSHCWRESPTKSFPWPLIGVSWVFCCESRDLEIHPLNDQPLETVFNNPLVFFHQQLINLASLFYMTKEQMKIHALVEISKILLLTTVLQIWLCFFLIPFAVHILHKSKFNNLLLIPQKWIFNALAHYAENTAVFDSRTKLLK